MLHAAGVELTARGLLLGTAISIAALGYLIVNGGQVPAWLFTAAVLIAVVAGILLHRRGRSGLVEAGEENDALRSGLGRHRDYSRHLQNSLDALQRVVGGDVDAELPYYLEQAVLAPARDILTEKPLERVRLSVLVPSRGDRERWTMAWAAGHSFTGQRKYNERIADTLSRHAFESGEPQSWPDSTNQTEFRQNPEASAPTRAMVSMPIFEGDRVLGVFNAISSESNAFDEAEKTFLASLAGVVAVAVGVWNQR